MPIEIFESVQTLSFSLLFRICEESRHEPILRLLLNRIALSSPKPCLVPVTSTFAPASDAIEAQMNLFSSLTQVHYLDYSPCGRHLVVGKDCDAGVLDAETRRVMTRALFYKSGITAVKFASSSKIVSASRDRTISVWDWKSREISFILLRGHSDIVRDVPLRCDGTKIFSASDDCTVKVWSLTGGEAIATYRQKAAVECVSVHGDNVAIVTKGSELTLSILDLDHVDREQRVLFSNPKIRYAPLTFNKNGRYLAIGSEDFSIQILRTDC